MTGNGWASSTQVVSTGSDGHYTSRIVPNPQINVGFGSTVVSGWSATPGTAMTITVYRNGVNLGSVTTGTSPWDGNFSTDLPAGPLAGDILLMEESSGVSRSVTVPTLTARPGATLDRVEGLAPANRPLTAMVWRSQWGLPASSSAVAGADSRYSASFLGQNWDPSTHSPVQPGAACSRLGALYCAPDGQRFQMWNPEPSLPASDSYEPDNDLAAARFYAAPQHHTFHVAGDVDWVRVEVPAGPPLIYTVAARGNAIGHVDLLMPDGLTSIGSWPLDGSGTSGMLLLPGPATYYVRLAADGVSCGSEYDLSVLPVRSYLPVVLRN
jgi:hypothetical protein